MTEKSSAKFLLFTRLLFLCFRPIKIKVAIWNLTIQKANMFQSNRVNKGFLPKIIKLIWAKIWCALFKN